MKYIIPLYLTLLFLINESLIQLQNWLLSGQSAPIILALVIGVIVMIIVRKIRAELERRTTNFDDMAWTSLVAFVFVCCDFYHLYLFDGIVLPLIGILRISIPLLAMRYILQQSSKRHADFEEKGLINRLYFICLSAFIFTLVSIPENLHRFILNYKQDSNDMIIDNYGPFVFYLISAGFLAFVLSRFTNKGQIILKDQRMNAPMSITLWIVFIHVYVYCFISCFPNYLGRVDFNSLKYTSISLFITLGYSLLFYLIMKLVLTKKYGEHIIFKTQTHLTAIICLKSMAFLSLYFLSILGGPFTLILTLYILVLFVFINYSLVSAKAVKSIHS